MPGWSENYYFGTPPSPKKYVPNQISLICVWWPFYVFICLTANCFPVFLWTPNQTNENPPLPNNFNFSKAAGNLSPKVYNSYFVKSNGFFVFLGEFLNTISMLLSGDSAISLLAKSSFYFDLILSLKDPEKSGDFLCSLSPFTVAA